MNELKELIKNGIIVKILYPGYDLICQKCGEKTRIRNIEKLPKTCSNCKNDPYTGPGKKGRPYKK